MNPQRGYGDVFVSMPAYEVDLWGKIRRANESARARYLATEDAQRTVRQTLVAQVATTYLGLLELDYELEIAQRTLQVRTNSLALTAAREQGGVAAMQDVAQAKILVYGAEASIVDIQRQREQQENALCILLGRNPGPIQRGEGFAAKKARAEVPPVCPRRCWSAARTFKPPSNCSSPPTRTSARPRRRSIRNSPSPAFTATRPWRCPTCSTAPSRTWQFGPAVTMPLFTGGRLRANLKVTQAQYEEALATYQRTVQNAFREVSDSLIAYQRTREFRPARKTHPGQPRGHRPGQHPLRRRRHQLPGSALQRAGTLHRRTEPGPGPPERTAQRRPTLPRAGRRLARSREPDRGGEVTKANHPQNQGTYEQE